MVDGRAHEEGMRPVDVVLTSAQNKSAIKDLMEKIEQYRKGRDVYVVGVTNVGKSTLINAIIQEITGDKDVITTSRFQGRHWTRSKSHWTMDPTSTIHQGLSIRHQMAHYLTAKNSSMSALKRKQA